MPMDRRRFLKLVGGLTGLALLAPWDLLEWFDLDARAAGVPLPQYYRVRPPILVTDFSSTTGMTITQGTGAVALDTDQTKVRTGTASLKIQQAASASSALVDLDCRNAVFGGSGSEGFLSATDHLWHLRCFVDVPNNQNNLSFFPSNTAGGFVDYWTQNVMGTQISTMRPGYWWDRVEGRPDWTIGEGSPSWNTPIRTLRIRPNANANGALTTWCDALYRGGYARPQILFVFDDSNVEQYTIAKPILDAYGIKSTFYLIADPISRNVGGSMTEAQTAQLYAEGHDLAFHQWTNGYNNYAELTSAQLAEECDQWIAYAGKMGWTRAMHHLAYPQGVTNSSIIQTVQSKGFETARGTLRLHQQHLLGLDNPYDVRGWMWASADGTAGAIAWMNNAVKYGCSLPLGFHQFHATVSSGAQISATDFTTICAYAKLLERAGLADLAVVSQWKQGIDAVARPVRP